ncbi:MAG: hypothetical protein ACHP9T_12320 [Caulobacterales bacterium]|jgi:hypothetical protein
MAGLCARGLDVFAYFGNDIKSAAPFDAQALMGLLGETAYGEAGPACAVAPQSRRL